MREYRGEWHLMGKRSASAMTKYKLVYLVRADPNPIVRPAMTCPQKDREESVPKYDVFRI